MSDRSKEKLVGWHSKQHLELKRALATELIGMAAPHEALYLTPDGREVRVTYVHGDRRGPYDFSDAVCVGEVTKFVRGIY